MWFEVAEGRIEEYGGEYAECSNSLIWFAEDLPPDLARSVFEQALTHYQGSHATDPEMLDELRVMQGLMAAYEGNSDLARSIFAAIADSPLEPQGAWAHPARNFLSTYKSRQDLYRACSALNIDVLYFHDFVDGPLPRWLCDHRAALTQLVHTAFSHLSLTQLPQHLTNAGVNLLSHGWHDVDSDGVNDRWFVVTHPAQGQREFWLAFETPRGIKALFTSYIPSNADLTHPFTHEADFRVANPTGGEVVVQVRRNAQSGEPFLVWRVADDNDPIRVSLNEFKSIRDALIAGGDPVQSYSRVKEVTLQWESCPFETVVQDPFLHKIYDCPSVLYTLGLAAELAGDKFGAIESYLRITNEYPDRPLADLAKRRLAQ